MRFGTAGVLGSAGLLGSIDIDALTVSLLPMIRQGMETHEAAKVLVLGITSNTAVKFVIALIWGSGAFRKYVTLGFIGILATLIGSLIFIS